LETVNYRYRSVVRPFYVKNFGGHKAANVLVL